MLFSIVGTFIGINPYMKLETKPTPVVIEVPVSDVVYQVFDASSSKVIATSTVIREKPTPILVVKKKPIPVLVTIPLATATIPVPVTVTIEPVMASSTPITPFGDAVMPVKFDMVYRNDGVQILVSFTAPVYTYSGLKIETMRCFYGKEEILKSADDNFSFYSSGYPVDVYCNIGSYYQKSINQTVYIRETVPVDFIKIKGMVHD